MVIWAIYKIIIENRSQLWICIQKMKKMMNTPSGDCIEHLKFWFSYSWTSFEIPCVPHFGQRLLFGTKFYLFWITIFYGDLSNLQNNHWKQEPFMNFHTKNEKNDEYPTWGLHWTLQILIFILVNKFWDTVCNTFWSARAIWYEIVFISAKVG